MRALILALLATLGGGISFPADHGPHPASNVEWWYTTSIVGDGHGHRYAVFFTIWAQPLGLVARSNVVDLGADRIVHASEGARLGPRKAGALSLAVDTARLRFSERAPYGAFSIRAGGKRDGLDMVLVPQKPYVLQGRSGVIQQSVGGPSSYYSATRMAVIGTLTIAGRAVPVSGSSWLDHQWGGFGKVRKALRWDWFSCRFADRSELMLYRFLDLSNRPLVRYDTGTFVDPDGTPHAVARFRVDQIGASVRPPGAPIAYPQRWRIRVPGQSLDLSISPLARHQYLANRFVAGFWEGAARIDRGKPGICFVEDSREDQPKVPGSG